MNTRQLQYAIELSKMLNFSIVAEKLGVSQPALSKQILALENELGVKLFNRSTPRLTITPAGEYFLQEAKRLIYQEDQLIRSMEDFKTGRKGSLSIGISPFRSLYLMPDVVKALKQKFPEVRIVLHEHGSYQLRKETAEGKYDLAIVNLPVDESALDVTPIEADTLVLAVPVEAAKLPYVAGSTLPYVAFEDCKDLPFVVVGQDQEMRQLFERSCAAANFRPQITMEVVGLSTAWAMCRAGIGATLLPLQFINHSGYDENTKLFFLKKNLYTRQPVIITKQGQYLSPYAKYAIELLTEQANRDN